MEVTLFSHGLFTFLSSIQNFLAYMQHYWHLHHLNSPFTLIYDAIIPTLSPSSFTQRNWHSALLIPWLSWPDVGQVSTLSCRKHIWALWVWGVVWMGTGRYPSLRNARSFRGKCEHVLPLWRLVVDINLCPHSECILANSPKKPGVIYVNLSWNELQHIVFRILFWTHFNLRKFFIYHVGGVCFFSPTGLPPQVKGGKDIQLLIFASLRTGDGLVLT